MNPVNLAKLSYTFLDSNGAAYVGKEVTVYEDNSSIPVRTFTSDGRFLGSIGYTDPNGLFQTYVLQGKSYRLVIRDAALNGFELDEVTGIVPSNANPSNAAPLTGPLAITASRTLTAQDNGRTLVSNVTSAIVLTIPKGLASGFGCAVHQQNTGKVTFAAASGVTMTNVGDQYSTSGQKATIGLVNIAQDAYNVTGSTGA
jgi:hypothetical protein